MKTIKIFLSIAGFAFTGLCCGQLFSQSNSDILFYSAYYNPSSNSLEHHINPYPARTITGDHFDAPSLTRTYFVPIDYDISVESWMTKTFESNYYEEEIQIESWMAKTFESNYYEEDIQIESWMELPFDCAYFETGPEVEEWMTRPFTYSDQIREVIEEDIPVEAWMKSPWI
jgi:hypothetical protein